MSASIWNPQGTQEVPALPAVGPTSFVKGTVGVPGINFVGDTGTGVWSESDGYINFAVNGVNVLTIDSAGNVTANKLSGGVELDIASATTCDIGAQVTNTLRITGTSNITSFGTTFRGPIFIRFQSALTLTHSPTTLILPGAASISVSAGDTLIAVPKATAGVADGWYVVGYSSPAPLLNAVSSITGVPAGMPIDNVSSINGGQLAGFRNKIINGCCRVSQYGATAISNNLALAYGGADRIGCAIGFSGTGSGTLQQAATNLFVSGYGQNLVLTSTGTGAVLFAERLELLDTKELAGKQVTVSCSVWHNTGTTLSCGVSISKANAANVFTTLTQLGSSSETAVTSTLTRLKFTTTLGAADVTNGLQIGVAFTGVGAVSGAFFYVGDFQLEPGAVVTKFELRPYPVELMLCQRYFERLLQYQLAQYGAAGINHGHQIMFKVTKRTAPAILQTHVVANNCSTTPNNNTVNLDGFTSFRLVTALGAYNYAETATANAELY